MTQPQTCTKDEITTYTCKVDPGQTHTESFVTKKARGHAISHEESSTTPATCTTEGKNLIVAKCACGLALKSSTEVIAPLGHNWGEWTEVTAPTETSEGLKRHTCTREGCNAYEDRKVPKKPHVHAMEKVPAVTATCSETGNVEFWSCVDCGWSFYDAAGNFDVDDEADLIIPKTEHVRARSVDENIVEPTCTEEGSHDEVIRCLNCNQVLSTMGVTDQAKGHVPLEPQHEVLLEASCEETRR